MEHILVVDVGTSSLKTMLYNCQGALLCRRAFEYQPEFRGNGLVEQAPATWDAALQSTLKEAGNFARANNLKIGAIAVTSQRASVIPVDNLGRPLYNAVMWQDKRSVPYCDGLVEKLSLREIYKRTGLRANAYFSAPKMIWFKEVCPEIYNQAYKLLGVQDYIIYLLTGSFATDWTQASRTMLMNICDFSWDRVMLDISGIDPAKLPDLYPPGALVGGLSSQLSAVTGLPEGTPVIMGGGDQQCAALALNVLQPGFAEANTGTGSFVIAYADQPQFDEHSRTLCSAAAVPGKWIVEAGIFNTGSIYRWFKEQFYPEGAEPYELMNKEAAASPLGANGVMLLPHFEGSAAPYWDPLAKGMFFNLSLASSRGDLSRAILEGISLEIAHNLSLLEQLVGPVTTVSVAGGLTAFDLFNQIQADAAGREVICYDNNEASSLGALLSAAVSLGIYTGYSEAFRACCSHEPRRFTPVASNTEKYSRLFVRKDELYKALKENRIYELFRLPV